MDSTLIGLALYTLLIVGMGTVAVRRNRSLQSFLLADRRLGPWVAAFSERASGESAWLLIGLPGVAFAAGLSAWWVAAGCVGGIAFSWAMVARRLREETARRDAITLADYFAARFTDRCHALRLTATAIILFFFTFYVAAQFLAAGKVLQVALGVTMLQGMAIGALLVLLYTAAGGLYAVAWTDLAQGIVMLLTLTALPLAVLLETGAMTTLGARLAAAGGGYLEWAPGTTAWGRWSGVLGSLGIGLGYMGQPHLVLRFMAITSATAVRAGRVIAVAWAVIAFSGAIMIGLAGLAYFGPGALGPGGALTDQEQLMPLLARQFLPGWLAAIAICGAIAAMMSTADSQLLASASAISEDIYRRLLRPGAQPGRLLAIGRWSTVAVALAAFLLAWRADALVYSLVLYAWAGLGAAFGPPLLLSLWWSRTSRAGVLAGLVTGTAVVVIWYNVPALKALLYEMIPGFLASLAATAGFSLIFPAAADVRAGTLHRSPLGGEDHAR